MIPSEIFPKWNLKRPKLGNFDIILCQNVSEISPSELKISVMKGLRLKLITKICVRVNDVFKKLFIHDMEQATNLDEDLHSTQLVKEINARFLSLRLQRYGQEYMRQK